MKNPYVFARILVLLCIICFVSSCKGQSDSTIGTVKEQSPKKIPSPIGNYVTGTFEDSKGHLWFGTIEKGIARYNGSTLNYFTTKEGLPSNRVIGVIEDANGILWLQTGNGLSKFDGKTFTNFLVKKDDFSSNSISQLLIDSKGVFWVGTWAGVYQFNGKDFNYFPLPYPKVDTAINKDTKNWITEIKEDTQGNIWFARDGYGICKYDGIAFTPILKKDGLLSNNAVAIEIDTKGTLWIGTRVGEKDNADPNNRTGTGGLNTLSNNTMLSFPEIKGFNTNDVYEIYQDTSNNMWITTIENGVYKFDGKTFKNFKIPISIMSIMDDTKGNLWLGGAGGLYKIKNTGEIINVTTNGPWE